MGVKKITVEEVDALINYYLDLAKKLDSNDKKLNHIKIRLGHWSQIKKHLMQND